MMKIEACSGTVTIPADEYKELIQVQDRVNTVLKLFRPVPSVDRATLFTILTGREHV